MSCCSIGFIDDFDMDILIVLLSCIFIRNPLTPPHRPPLLQVDAIRRGLATIVPVQLLPLFTDKELEFMVCGKREIDIDFLKVLYLWSSSDVIILLPFP